MYDSIASNDFQEFKEEKAGYNLRFLVGLSLCFTISSFNLGYELGVMNISHTIVGRALGWGSSSELFCTLSACLLCAGAAAGASASGRLCNYLGRNKLVTRTNILFIIIVGINLVPYTITFLISRLLTGVCIGIFSVIPAIVINEISPTDLKGFLGTFIQLSVTLGSLCSFSLSAAFFYVADDAFSCFALYGFPLIFAVLQNWLLSSRYNYDTPIWLYNNKNFKELESLLKIIYEPCSWQSILHSMDSVEVTIIPKKKPRIIFLHSKFLANSLCVAQQFSGINVLIFYSNDIFKKLTFTELSCECTLVLGVVCFITAVPSLILISKVSRKNLLLSGTLGMSVSYAGFSLVSYFLIGEIKDLLTIVLLLLAVAFFQCSLGTVLWIYLTEIVDVLWVGSAITLQWICAFIIAGTYPILFLNNFQNDVDMFFVVCSIICLFTFCIIYFLATEINRTDRIRAINRSSLMN